MCRETVTSILDLTRHEYCRTRDFWGPFHRFNLIQVMNVRIKSTQVHYFFFSSLTPSRRASTLPSCLWSLTISPPLFPIHASRIFIARCKFSTFTTRQPMVEFHLLTTFSRFPLQKKEHKLWFDKNRTHDFRNTSRCAGYLLDHSGDKQQLFFYLAIPDYFLYRTCLLLILIQYNIYHRQWV